MEETPDCHWCDSDDDFRALQANAIKTEIYHCRTDGSCPGHEQVILPDGKRKTNPNGHGKECPVSGQ